MNNKTKILTAVIGVIVVGLGVTLMQPKTSNLQEPIVPVMVEEIQQAEEIQPVEETQEIEVAEEVEPAPEEIGEPDSIEVITEPEPIIEVAQVQVAEPTPVAVAEPEPIPVTEAIIEAPQAIEEQATYEPAPQEQAEQEGQEVQTYAEEPIVVPEVVTALAPASSGATYTTVYNGVSYTITQDIIDRGTTSRGYMTVDGIPGGAIAQAAGALKSTSETGNGSSGLTAEEVAELRENPTYNAPTVVWGITNQ